MLIADFIKEKFQKFGVTLSITELEALLLDNSIAADQTYTTSSSKKAKTALLQIIPEILVMPSVSEGGYSVRFDKDGILAYYKVLCSELGIEDKLNAQPKIVDRSNRW